MRAEVTDQSAEPITASPLIGAQLVIDPAGTLTQKTAELKSISLPQLQVHPGVKQALAQRGLADSQPTSFENVWLEVNEACIGLRLPTLIATGCEGADVDLLVEDVGTGRYALNSLDGVADITGSPAAAVDPPFTTRVPLLVGHTYVLRGAAGRTSVFAVTQVLSPQQFSALLRQKFQRGARRIAKTLGAETSGIEAGDVSGYDPSRAIVYFNLMVLGPKL